jgi:hypothetical protein
VRHQHSGDIDFCERYNDDGAIELSHQPPDKTVTKTEILAALKNLTENNGIQASPF